MIKRRRYRRSCQCAAAPALLTAAAPPRLIPKGILGISVWVTVLIDKYLLLLYRPTYRLLADLRAHGLDLAQGTITDGMRRLAPLFAPLREACAKVLRSLRNHWQGLTLFVEDPDLPMDNNQAERALRGPVVGRKNYYGSGAQWSGELSATLFSLFHTLERWRINPRTWLTEYLHACADAGGRVPADFERFLPWNRREARVPRATPAQVVDSRAA